MPTQDGRWYQHAIFYQLYVRAFRDSNGDGNGDLRGVIEKLDYLKDLGIDCIWVMPLYPSPLKDDGYDISDYQSIHPDYGTLQDFDDLIHEAHARGLRIVMDLVVNHTSDQHPWFVESRSSRQSPKRDWYVWSDSPERYQDARIIFIDTEESNWSYDEQTGQYYWHRFYSSQPDLNYDNPNVQKAMLDIMTFWLDKGIDGFRVDAVPYLIEREGTNCENLPETHQFVKKMRAALEASHPDAMLLAEANQPPEDVYAYFGDGDEFHMAFNFPVMPRIFLSLHLEQAGLIREMWQRIPEIPDGCQWCTFLRNHDELTLEMVTLEERKLLWDAYAPDDRMRINLGIRRRLAPLLNHDKRRIVLASAILFSLPGAPIIYYGDEIGMGDNIEIEDRNGVRLPMQWEATPDAGFSKAPAGKLYLPVISHEATGPAAVNVRQQQDDPGSLLNAMRRLVDLRKRYPVFAQGAVEFLDILNPSVLGMLRLDLKDAFIVLHNLSGSEQVVSLRQATINGYEPLNVTGEVAMPQRPTDEWEPYEISLAPYQSIWLHRPTSQF